VPELEDAAGRPLNPTTFMYVSIIQTTLRRPARGSSPCGRLAHRRPTPVNEQLGWFSGQGSDVVLGERHQRRDVAHAFQVRVPDDGERDKDQTPNRSVSSPGGTASGAKNHRWSSCRR
jgi:hypothetical protein